MEATTKWGATRKRKRSGKPEQKYLSSPSRLLHYISSDDLGCLVLSFLGYVFSFTQCSLVCKRFLEWTQMKHNLWLEDFCDLSLISWSLFVKKLNCFPFLKLRKLWALNTFPGDSNLKAILSKHPLRSIAVTVDSLASCESWILLLAQAPFLEEVKCFIRVLNSKAVTRFAGFLSSLPHLKRVDLDIEDVIEDWDSEDLRKKNVDLLRKLPVEKVATAMDPCLLPALVQWPLRSIEVERITVDPIWQSIYLGGKFPHLRELYMQDHRASSLPFLFTPKLESVVCLESSQDSWIKDRELLASCKNLRTVQLVRQHDPLNRKPPGPFNWFLLPALTDVTLHWIIDPETLEMLGKSKSITTLSVRGLPKPSETQVLDLPTVQNLEICWWITGDNYPDSKTFPNLRSLRFYRPRFLTDLDFVSSFKSLRLLELSHVWVTQLKEQISRLEAKLPNLSIIAESPNPS